MKIPSRTMRYATLSNRLRQVSITYITMDFFTEISNLKIFWLLAKQSLRSVTLDLSKRSDIPHHSPNMSQQDGIEHQKMSLAAVVTTILWMSSLWVALWQSYIHSDRYSQGPPNWTNLISFHAFLVSLLTMIGQMQNAWLIASSYRCLTILKYHWVKLLREHLQRLSV